MRRLLRKLANNRGEAMRDALDAVLAKMNLQLAPIDAPGAEAVAPTPGVQPQPPLLPMLSPYPPVTGGAGSKL